MKKKIKLVIPILFTIMLSSCAATEGIDVASPSNEAYESTEIMQENEVDDPENGNSDTGLSTTVPAQPTLPTFTSCPTIAAEDFLSRFVSLFFGLHSDEPVIKINEPGNIRDDDGNWV